MAATCNTCGVTKTLENTRKVNPLKDWWASHCRECENTRKNEHAKKSRNTLVGKLRALVWFSRSRAKCKGTPHDITVQWINAMWENCQGLCTATGLPLTWSGSNRSWDTVSLDQIIPSEGYTKDNTRLVCWGFNKMKSTFSDDELETIIRGFLRRRDNER